MALLVGSGICFALTLSQDIAPGKPLYHTGWYALLLAGALAIALLHARSTNALLVAGGTLLLGSSGLASGLLGPDTRIYIGAPGSLMNVPEVGTLRFPLASPGWVMPGPVSLSRAGRPELNVPAHGQAYAGSFILRELKRPITLVNVFDERGNHLTVTQPQSPQFLSPFLLFAQQARIAGKMLPIDSFVVPAKRVEVKAVLLDVRRTGVVLYAVHDFSGKLLRKGLKIVGIRSVRTVGNLRIQTILQQYPSVEVASGPHPALLIPGLMLIAGGLLRNRFHWRNKSSPLLR